MRKMFVLFVLSFFFLFSGVCRAGMTVSPLEVSIVMEDSFVSGNTFRVITVTNNELFSVNVSWYVEHPDPISWMRSNRSVIPDLSWVDVEPEWSIISPNGSAEFFVFLYVPDVDENRGQHWETWVTFRQNESQFINVENAVRVFIDTPAVVSSGVDQSLFFVFGLVLLVVVFVVVFLFRKR